MARTLILGGSGGIGSVLARLMREKGDDVVLLGRDAIRLDSMAAKLGCTAVPVDVTEPDELRSALAGLADAGPVDRLAYAVGTITVKPLGSLSAADFDRDYRVNALGAALTLQTLAPALRQSEAASVVLFSTVAVAQGFTGHASIAMAKGAVEGLALSMAAEWAPKVRVNCVAPSLTRTPLAAAMTQNEPLAKAVGEMHAMRRLGEPEDAANLAAFLLSEAAGWITGQIIGVDGGRASLRTKG